MNVETVKRYEASGNVKKLVKALGNGDPYVRSAAARALERLRRRDAVLQLIASLESDPDDFVRKCAASALGNIRDERAIPAPRRQSDPVTHPRSVDRGESFHAAAKALARFGPLPAGDSSMEFTRFGPPDPSRIDRLAALLEVVGESFHQDALARAAQNADLGDEGWLVAAQLCAEPANPQDPNAVRVNVAGETVGYLSRSDAVRFSAALRAQGPLDCQVEIRGDRRLGAFIVAMAPLSGDAGAPDTEATPQDGSRGPNYCPECGTRVSESAKFCGECGYALASGA